MYICICFAVTDRQIRECVDEITHAANLIERILFLEGLPNLQQLDKLLIGENVAEALKCDLQLEQLARPVLREATAQCESCSDYESREPLEESHDGEEDRIDWIEIQLGLIDKVGLQSDLQ
jgi:bacterioferritin